MTDRIDCDVAEAKLERVDELYDEIRELDAEIEKKLDRADELIAEAKELVE